MSDSTSHNLLRAWTHPVYSIPLPPLPQAEQVGVHPAYLPGASIFAGMTPEQMFWFQHLLGQGVGQGAPPGQVNPYFMMQMLQGPQGAIYPPEEEQAG